jgi:H+/Cl- antiporter ClcA
MKEDLVKIIMISSCLSVLLSVILFIVSEIHQMVANAMFQRKFFAKFKEELPPTFADDYRRESQEHERHMFKAWLILFVPTVLLGILGGGLLIYAFSESLILEIIQWVQS